MHRDLAAAPVRPAREALRSAELPYLPVPSDRLLASGGVSSTTNLGVTGRSRPNLSSPNLDSVRAEAGSRLAANCCSLASNASGSIRLAERSGFALVGTSGSNLGFMKKRSGPGKSLTKDNCFAEARYGCTLRKTTPPLVIPKPDVSARNPLTAGGEAADSSRDNARASE